MTLQDKLYKLRRDKGYSQEELAEKLDVSRQAVSKWERGESSPDINNIIAIAKVYDISVDELAGCIRGDESVRLDKPQSVGISLKKPSCAESSGISDDFVSMGVDADEEEIYPQNNNAASQQDIMPNTAAQYNSYGNASGYTYTENTSGSYKSEKRKFKIFGNNPPAYNYNNSVQKTEWCRKAKKFPFWALMLVLFLFFGGVFELWEISWAFFLLIPIYYSVLSAYEKNNLNYLCYPVLAVLGFFGTAFVDNGQHFGGNLSAIGCFFWFGSIPLYYTAIAAYRHRKSKYFCFPVLVVVLHLILGIINGRFFTAFLWLYALIPFYYIYSSSIDKKIFGKTKK